MVRKLLAVLMVAVFGLALAGCESTTSVSTGGASLTFGTQIDESKLEIKDPGTSFKAGTGFYYVFDNNAAFGTNQLVLEVADQNGKVLLTQPYTVKNDSTRYANTLGFRDPGKYKVRILLGDKEKARAEVIIN